MSTSRDPLYRRHRFPPEVISYAVWLYFRFPLSLCMVEEMLAARGICVTYETVRQWGRRSARRSPIRSASARDKWYMDEVGHLDCWRAVLPIPTKPPVYNGMIAPRDSWMMPPLYNEMIPPGAPRALA
jgi:putative transposase